jgi:hypothetical protein
MPVSIATEGYIDAAVARKVLRECGLKLDAELGKKGKGFIDANVAKFNRAASRTDQWVVLRDLDHDAPCGGALARRLLKEPAPEMRFRIVVREIESWILADIESLTKVFSLPTLPDIQGANIEQSPKLRLLKLFARSKSSTVKREMVRGMEDTGLEAGPLYNPNLVSYVKDHWRIKVAAANSVSLRRAILRIAELKKQQIS